MIEVMLKHVFVAFLLISFICFLYGIYNIYIEVEENACRMTYMFQKPQFSEVKIDNKLYAQYGLFHYYEGAFRSDGYQNNLNGLPIIFVPGNGGSYKQGRSLASVAIRKALDDGNNIHMDYFTVDFNDELSAIYGGYLEDQKLFLKICIKSVLALYKHLDNNNKSVVLIGHSMGGKIAQSVLTDNDTVKLINTVIFISSPLDNPVVNIDTEMNLFYEKTNKMLMETRSQNLLSNANICTNTVFLQEIAKKFSIAQQSNKSLTENVLLISIGGGNRDLLVRAGLTSSRFSDIHAMTSSIPNVWVSCDHLSSVWCYQLVVVINKFLFEIAVTDSLNNAMFNHKKTDRLTTAVRHFSKFKNRINIHEVGLLKENNDQDLWHEDFKRVFQKRFKKAVKQNYNHMISLRKFETYQKLYIEINNFHDKHWLYGCTAQTLWNGKNVCESGFSIDQYVEKMPFKDKVRSMAILDLNNLRKTFLNWTHVVAHITSIDQPMNLNVDIYNSKERHFNIIMPRWYNFLKANIINETMQGSLYYKVYIQDLDESFQTLRVNIDPLSCSNSYNVITKICVPWAHGFIQYKTLSETTKGSSIYISTPFDRPYKNNESIVLEIFLDAACRYKISYQFSLDVTLSRIVLEFYHWLPSHIIAVFIIVLRNHIFLFEKKTLKHIRPYSGIFQFSSIYVIPTCRILRKFLVQFEFLSIPKLTTSSLIVPFIIHATAIVISVAANGCVLLTLFLTGGFIHKIFFRVTDLQKTKYAIFRPLLTSLPFTFIAFSIGVAVSTCSGIALIVASIVYFILLLNAYRRHLTHIATGLSKKRQDQTDTMFTPHSNINKIRCTKEDNKIEDDNFKTIHETEKLPNSYKMEEIQYFPFHLSMFFLLLALTLLNIPVTIAWFKSYSRNFSNSSLIPSIAVLGSLCLFLQLNVSFHKFGNNVTSLLLYLCASACILYCQEDLYRLNLIIATVFIIILIKEILARIMKR
ncbi:GPI inositol-deacylase isoform X2 [Teleopsis dalmanni]|uniref:GPI inositol-deacylase isoform X2 n=1 Tax=Teleopsis dalmanni TaxID=139649 RepID=UPI0018CDD145|nr:GPI inositol-deacylase isoform X2 [Teleopsis dalmanni]